MDTDSQKVPKLALSGFVKASRANGPGSRVVVWVQGCSIGCPGCFNPTTHGARKADTPVAEVVARVLAAAGPDTAGVTFSGGEPFEQAEALAELARQLRAAWPKGTLMVYSGHSLTHLQSVDAPAGSEALLAWVDYLVDGAFEVRRPGRGPWQASQNQRLWVLGRPFPENQDSRADGHIGEFHVQPDGSVLLSGLPDANLKNLVKSLS